MTSRDLLHVRPKRARIVALSSVVRALAPLCIFAASACGSAEPAASSCPNDLPAACPTAPPSYAREVAPIVTAKCVVCHGPGGVEATRDLSTYEHVYAQRSMVLNQVYRCAMPPREGQALTADERRTLLAWLVCKAPQN